LAGGVTVQYLAEETGDAFYTSYYICSESFYDTGTHFSQQWFPEYAELSLKGCLKGFQWMWEYLH
jgi:hypothetical protein